ncbi:anaerobic sulfatase maturase [Craterilacuibacter sinensis]|uniref:Anaerobic sulfatase maturase n=1 Tax=Craterilacuibacter sinensis TaxID=2686017 RepID=A0A845BME4_9NEIS|nr:anaerobic sulfatase maturase [Craterilacuibacter sinensis]MXR37515.1 anaerobic sulfatase maturase [Craterilacuibacter sinensis]
MPTLPPLPVNGRRRFHMMVKPAGALCNLDCSYCFYLHKETLLDQPQKPQMSDALLEEHIRQYIEGQSGDTVVFSWQGGEPTVLGLPYFEKIVALQAKYKKPGQAIENDLQTNGVLLDENWVHFLKRHRFLVGLSVDGPAQLHDKHRPSKGGKPTHAAVLRAARLLNAYEVPFAALCVVNRDNARAPREVYRFLADELGTYRVQFTPCVEARAFRDTAPGMWPDSARVTPDSERARPGHPLSIVTDWSVDADDWGRFLIAVWDEWLARDFGRVHVNLFETAVAQSLGLPAQTCTQSEFCGKGLALEHDGSVYSCDHFVYPEYRLGNIASSHQAALALSPRQQAFGFAKRDTLPSDCRSCPHLKLCWGECPKNRLLKTASGEAGLNYLCRGWQAFYGHIARDMPGIVAGLPRH